MLAIFKTIFGKEININIHLKKDNEHFSDERGAFSTRELFSGENGERFWQKWRAFLARDERFMRGRDFFGKNGDIFLAKSERKFKKRFPGENGDIFLAKK
jgi:hypothetical protein